MTVVLLHGAWSTGSVWDEVGDHLGGEVIAPTLRGCGPNGDPWTGLDQVVRGVVALLGGLDDVTIVAHSWSGLVAWQVAARTACVHRLLLVGAFDAVPGSALVDAFDDAQRHDELAAIEANDGWWPPPARSELAADPALAPGTVDRLARSLLPHPGRTVTDPVPDDLDVGDVEVLRLGEAAGPLDAGHWPMVTAPGALAAWIHRSLR